MPRSVSAPRLARLALTSVAALALVGCSATYDSSWPKILLYSSPPALFALGAVPYASR